MDPLFDTLREWQEIAGAFLGGLFALLVAFIVAHSSQRRGERTAAYIVLVTLGDFLMVYRFLSEGWQSVVDKENVDRNYWIGERAIANWPFLAPDFSAARAQLIDIDEELALALEQFGQIYKSMWDAKGRIEAVLLQRVLPDDGSPLRKMLDQDMKAVTTGFDNSIAVAARASGLVAKLVLARGWWVRRWLRLFAKKSPHLSGGW